MSTSRKLCHTTCPVPLPFGISTFSSLFWFLVIYKYLQTQYISFVLFYSFLFFLGVIHRSAQSLLLVVQFGIISDRVRESYGMLGNESQLVTCKANTLGAVLLLKLLQTNYILQRSFSNHSWISCCLLHLFNFHSFFISILHSYSWNSSVKEETNHDTLEKVNRNR